VTRRACVVGAGAREHALALALARSADVIVAPGSAGITAARVRSTGGSPHDVEADVFVIGPEQPLVDGLADALRARGRLVVGPGRDGARLEGSKAYMKEVLVAAGVPTAPHRTFDDPDDAAAFLATRRGTVVVKTDGLAAGKGVLVTDDLELAARDAADKLSGRAFGDAGRRVVIEDGLSGEECSLLVLVDGGRGWPMAPARDYKRLRDGGSGPNTGGMGAVSPPPGVDDALVDRIMADAVEPTLAELQARGVDYRGVLYAGVMVDGGKPSVLEYNVRLGDPEAQVVLARLADDPFDVFCAVAGGTLTEAPRTEPGAAVTVVLAAEGYPAVPITGAEIAGLADDGQLAEPVEGVVVHHGATRREGAAWRTDGGRVLSVTARGATVAEARGRAYAAAARVQFPGSQRRSDVAA
jgi:phosphoribosylamine--glycine ligase